MKKRDLLEEIDSLRFQLNNLSFDTVDASEANALLNRFRKLTDSAANATKEQTPDLDLKDRDEQPNVSQTDHETGLQVVAQVSHEIRTPLNGIIGFTELLGESMLNEAQMAHVSAIQSASNSLMEIINELLEYAKLATGNISFETIDFNLSSAIKDIDFLCQTLIVADRVTLKTHIDPTIPEFLLGDPAKLGQILLNLLGNAVKFVKQGDISLHVSLKEKTEKIVWLTFVVSDQGIGIREEELPYIFDRYRQVGNSESTAGGTGLGLSIVKKLIDHQKGNIAVSSVFGKGTTFTFELPFSISTAGTVLEQPTKSAIERELLNGLVVLVFEDNTLNQRLIAERLNKWNCKTFVTDDFHQGMGFLQENVVDIVLMDLKMPNMDGFEISKNIRQHGTTRISEVPIIALTADFTVKDKKKSELAGMNGYLLKPYRPEALFKILLENTTPMEKNKDFDNYNGTMANGQDVEAHFTLDDIMSDCMNDVSLLEELIRLYKQNAIEFIGAAKIHLEQSNFKGLEFALHKMKSGLAMMKTYSLHAIVTEMHTCCKAEKDLKHLNYLYQSFLEEYPLVENQIEMALTSIKQQKS